MDPSRRRAPHDRDRLLSAGQALGTASGLDQHSTKSLAFRMLFRRTQVQASVMAHVGAFVFVTFVLLAFVPLIPLLRSRAARAEAPPGE